MVGWGGSPSRRPRRLRAVQRRFTHRKNPKGASRHGDHEKHHCQRQPSGAAQAPCAGACKEHRQLRGRPAFAPAGQAVPGHHPGD
nr:MAG TPA: hypothetical protein [Caudoviricetes sp.]